MNDQPKSKWYWSFLRWNLIALAILLTLAAIVITEEDWRGKHDWEAYKKQAAARGEMLDQFDATTNAIPDEQNFVKAPVFAGLWTMTWDENKQAWQADGPNGPELSKINIAWYDGAKSANPVGDWKQARLARFLPLAPGSGSPAADVLQDLSKYDSTIADLRLASARPYAHFANFDLSDTQTMDRLLVYLAEMKRSFQLVELHSLAELASGQNDRAMDDVLLLLQLNEKLRQDPLLITHLVSTATMNLSLQPVYNGLAQHRWADPQLAKLARQLAAKDFLADYQKAMRGERAIGLASLENMRLTREYKTVDNSSGTDEVTTMSLRLTPAAFFYQSELARAQLSEQYCLPLVDLNQRLVSPAAVRRANAAVQSYQRHFSPYKNLALMAYPAISKSVEHFAEIQSYTDLAQVACALERYRLAHGQYPGTLDALAPSYIDQLPHDVINGQPLQYRLTEGGHYLLYSVGWNETDDGGKIVVSKKGVVYREQGDWVWNNAAK